MAYYQGRPTTGAGSTAWLLASSLQAQGTSADFLQDTQYYEDQPQFPRSESGQRPLPTRDTAPRDIAPRDTAPLLLLRPLGRQYPNSNKDGVTSDDEGVGEDDGSVTGTIAGKHRGEAGLVSSWQDTADTPSVLATLIQHGRQAAFRSGAGSLRPHPPGAFLRTKDEPNDAADGLSGFDDSKAMPMPQQPRRATATQPYRYKDVDVPAASLRAYDEDGRPLQHPRQYPPPQRRYDFQHRGDEWSDPPPQQQLAQRMRQQQGDEPQRHLREEEHDCPQQRYMPRQQSFHHHQQQQQPGPQIPRQQQQQQQEERRQKLLLLQLLSAQGEVDGGLCLGAIAGPSSRSLPSQVISVAPFLPNRQPGDDYGDGQDGEDHHYVQRNSVHPAGIDLGHPPVRRLGEGPALFGGGGVAPPQLRRGAPVARGYDDNGPDAPAGPPPHRPPPREPPAPSSAAVLRARGLPPQYPGLAETLASASAAACAAGFSSRQEVQQVVLAYVGQTHGLEAMQAVADFLTKGDAALPEEPHAAFEAFKGQGRGSGGAGASTAGPAAPQPKAAAGRVCGLDALAEAACRALELGDGEGAAEAPPQAAAMAMEVQQQMRGGRGEYRPRCSGYGNDAGGGAGGWVMEGVPSCSESGMDQDEGYPFGIRRPAREPVGMQPRGRVMPGMPGPPRPHQPLVGRGDQPRQAQRQPGADPGTASGPPVLPLTVLHNDRKNPKVLAPRSGRVGDVKHLVLPGEITQALPESMVGGQEPVRTHVVLPPSSAAGPRTHGPQPPTGDNTAVARRHDIVCHIGNGPGGFAALHLPVSEALYGRPVRRFTLRADLVLELELGEPVTRPAPPEEEVDNEAAEPVDGSGGGGGGYGGGGRGTNRAGAAESSSGDSAATATGTSAETTNPQPVDANGNIARTADGGGAVGGELERQQQYQYPADPRVSEAEGSFVATASPAAAAAAPSGDGGRAAGAEAAGTGIGAGVKRKVVIHNPSPSAMRPAAVAATAAAAVASGPADVPGEDGAGAPRHVGGGSGGGAPAAPAAAAKTGLPITVVRPKSGKPTVMRSCTGVIGSKKHLPLPHNIYRALPRHLRDGDKPARVVFRYVGSTSAADAAWQRAAQEDAAPSAAGDEEQLYCFVGNTGSHGCPALQVTVSPRMNGRRLLYIRLRTDFTLELGLGDIVKVTAAAAAAATDTTAAAAVARPTVTPAKGATGAARVATSPGTSWGKDEGMEASEGMWRGADAGGGPAAAAVPRGPLDGTAGAAAAGATEVDDSGVPYKRRRCSSNNTEPPCEAAGEPRRSQPINAQQHHAVLDLSSNQATGATARETNAGAPVFPPEVTQVLAQTAALLGEVWATLRQVPRVQLAAALALSAAQQRRGSAGGEPGGDDVDAIRGPGAAALASFRACLGSIVGLLNAAREAAAAADGAAAATAGGNQQRRGGGLDVRVCQCLLTAAPTMHVAVEFLMEWYGMLAEAQDERTAVECAMEGSGAGELVRSQLEDELSPLLALMSG